MTETLQSNSSDWYRNKVILAPMVRVSTLPFRLLAIEYGADIVYSEEIIDWKLLRSKKRFQAVNETTEFYDPSDGTVFFSTCDKERGKVIVQIGTSDECRALKAAKILEPYVVGVDINMGCPKEFSIKGGMGAALLTQPLKIKAILTTLVKNLSIPVTCKIRILPDLKSTLDLCRMIELCGVAAIAVHARKKEERPQHPNHDDFIAAIAKTLKIPVIANGGSKNINCYDDLQRFCRRAETCSVMVARAAMWNCSIFRSEGTLHLDEVISNYLRFCIRYDNSFTCTKYTVQNMLRDLQESPRGKAFLEAQTLRELAVIWGLEEEYDAALEQQLKLKQRTENITSVDQRKWPYNNRDEAAATIITNADTGKIISVTMPMQFLRGNYSNADLPKMILNRHFIRNDMKNPVFGAERRDRNFIGYMISMEDSIRYETSSIEKSRRYAEQAAALVFLHYHKLVPPTYGFTANPGCRKYQHFAHDAQRISQQEWQQLQPTTSKQMPVNIETVKSAGDENSTDESKRGRSLSSSSTTDACFKVFVKSVNSEASADEVSFSDINLPTLSSMEQEEI